VVLLHATLLNIALLCKLSDVSSVSTLSLPHTPLAGNVHRLFKRPTTASSSSSSRQHTAAAARCLVMRRALSWPVESRRLPSPPRWLPRMRCRI
jgi:hypothetical protein